jgi:hypothetical protein
MAPFRNRRKGGLFVRLITRTGTYRIAESVKRSVGRGEYLEALVLRCDGV